ncbi:uncharacterized protein STEHIDRAFT_159429 [Stereum hirsutum FP-91666 SS1]|uniref:uncharacterized protein n=1 Tax=Stereum hirsutum (strain FP-91666) TaxID=721885 RepID=UPI000444A359|nr:uncharacterized protein STEHIDRAFT_159429 [Stereum hirsutum FP-91666 SS1]EIM83813.1 hypothetical protein STEHIDRAFT_159429 [Stereum hirsutum FP-91666 SS1]
MVAIFLWLLALKSLATFVSAVGDAQTIFSNPGNICSSGEVLFACNCPGPNGGLNIYIDENGMGRCCGNGGEVFFLSESARDIRGVCCAAGESYQDGECRTRMPSTPRIPGTPPGTGEPQGPSESLRSGQPPFTDQPSTTRQYEQTSSPGQPPAPSQSPTSGEPFILGQSSTTLPREQPYVPGQPPIPGVPGQPPIPGQAFVPGQPYMPPGATPPASYAPCDEGSDSYVSRKTGKSRCCRAVNNLFLFDLTTREGTCCPTGSSYKSLDGEGGCCPDDYDYYGQGWCIYTETGTQTPEVPPVEPHPLLVCPEGAHVMYLDKSRDEMYCCPDERNAKIFNWQTLEGVCCPENQAYCPKDALGRGGRCCPISPCDSES